MSKITVKIHGAKSMEKMRASSLADLVRMAEQFDLDPGPAVSAGEVAIT